MHAEEFPGVFYLHVNLRSRVSNSSRAESPVPTSNDWHLQSAGDYKQLVLQWASLSLPGGFISSKMAGGSTSPSVAQYSW